MTDDLDSGPHELRDRPFTTHQALDAGLTHGQLTRAVEARWLRRPMRGIYIPGSVPDTLETRCAALALSVPDDAFVCDHSAAWLHAGDRALFPGDHVKVPDVSCFLPTDGGRLRRGNVRSGEREIRASEIMTVGGLRVTTPLRTALDIGRLARNNDVRLHGMDTMLSTGTFEKQQLLDEVPRFKGYRGVVGLRALAPLADAGAQSFGESALRLRWHQAHLPYPTTQHPVPGPDDSTYYLDIALPEDAFSGEYDGEEFHSTPEQLEHDATRRRWLRREGWTLHDFRAEHVLGRRQTAEQRLRNAYAAVMTGQKSRRYF